MNIEEQKREIETRAGVHADSIEATTLEIEQFAAFCDTFKRIHAVKALGYGDYCKTHGDESVELFATQHFCDVKRKFVRAKTFVERMLRGEQVSFEDLIDTYSDLAVYSIMGLQMAFHCINSKNIENESLQQTFGPIL